MGAGAPCVSSNGTLYFFSGLDGGIGEDDIYYSKLVKGKYTKRVNLGKDINSAYDDNYPFLPPEESYIIFCSCRPGGAGGSDLYISHRKNNVWTSPQNLGLEINTEKNEYSPRVSPDGKYLYFTRNSGSDNAIYRIDIKALDIKG